MSDWLDYICAGIGAAIGYFFGEVDGVFQALVVCSVVDYITGFAVGWTKNKLSSRIGFKGIASKFMIFAIVGLAHIIDREMLGGTALLRDAVLFFYLANEGLSILENAVDLNVPFPMVIKKHLLKFKEQEGQECLDQHTKNL